MNDRRGVTLATRIVHDGRIFSVSLDRVRLPHGRDVDMEIVRHPASVVLLPMPDPGHIVLVRQYRYAVDRWLWELPAGSLEPGEQAEQAAIRECHEEVGLVPGRIERLAALFPTPGYCDEEMIFVRLSDLARPAAAAVADADEDLEPRVFAVEEARAMVKRGEIVDMKTVVGLGLAEG